MRRAVLFFPVLILIAALLSGCGQTDSQPQSNATLVKEEW